MLRGDAGLPRPIGAFGCRGSYRLVTRDIPTAADGSVGRQRITRHAKLAGGFQRNFQHLIDKIGISIEFAQRLREQFDLEIAEHAVWTVQADKAGVQVDAGILPLLAGARCLTPKIDRVSRDECPIALDNQGKKIPVLGASTTQPDDVRGLSVAPAL